MTNITVHRGNPSHTRPITVGDDTTSYTAHAYNGRNGSNGWVIRFKGQDIDHAATVRLIEFAVRQHLNADHTPTQYAIWYKGRVIEETGYFPSLAAAKEYVTARYGSGIGCQVQAVYPVLNPVKHAI